ncbi:MAG: hypothetical protein PF904_04845 [Kiritimatiellae bacterium]|jgi:Zn-finger protein|nr:hypothetical protein [Kiritimatiellia bacterium]
MSNQIQCESCYCTLYFTGEDEPSGTTGELCWSCQTEQDVDDGDDDD